MSVGLILQVQAYGGVVEWLMALVLKTSEVKASAGSNPAPSVLIGLMFWFAHRALDLPWSAFE